jgi:hypothetical protein
MFADGGGGHTVLDCSAPSEPSLLRDCFRESFAGPDWGKPIASLADWLRNGTRWMAAGLCRFDADRDLWWPAKNCRAYWPQFDITTEPNPRLGGPPE